MTVDLCLQPEVPVVQDLTTTARGSKGWGSTDTPDLIVSASPELPYTSPCTDKVPLIHSHCPPTIPWHNQFMPPLFLYFLCIVLGARERRLKTALHSPTQREREGPVTRAQAKLRHQVSHNSGEGVVGVFQSGKCPQEYETSPATRLQPGTDDVAVALLAFVIPVVVSVHFSGGSSLKLDKGLYRRVPDQQSTPVIPSGHRGSVAPDIPVEIAALLDRVLQGTFPGRSSTECCDSAEIKTIEVPVISEESNQYGVASEAESDSASAQALGRRVWGEPRMLPGNRSCHAIQVERDCCDLQQLDPWADSTEDAAGDALI